MMRYWAVTTTTWILYWICHHLRIISTIPHTSTIETLRSNLKLKTETAKTHQTSQFARIRSTRTSLLLLEQHFVRKQVLVRCICRNGGSIIRSKSGECDSQTANMTESSMNHHSILFIEEKEKSKDIQKDHLCTAFWRGEGLTVVVFLNDLANFKAPRRIKISTGDRKKKENLVYISNRMIIPNYRHILIYVCFIIK